jgi:hypothetical protein
MRHRATPRFWARYKALPAEVRQAADRCYALLREDSRHPSLHLKKIGRFWSVRVGLYNRALAVESGSDLVWVWIGRHAEYERLIESAK